jgi:hypothetical protein
VGNREAIRLPPPERALPLVHHKVEGRTWATFWRATIESRKTADVAAGKRKTLSVSAYFISGDNGGRNYAVSTLTDYSGLNLPSAPPLAVTHSTSPGTTSVTPPSSFGDRNNRLAHDSLRKGFTVPCARNGRAPLHQIIFFPKFLIPYAAGIFTQNSPSR